MTLQVLHHTCMKGEWFIVTHSYDMARLHRAVSPIGTLIQHQHLMAQMAFLNKETASVLRHPPPPASYSNGMSHRLRIVLHLLFLVLFPGDMTLKDDDDDEKEAQQTPPQHVLSEPPTELYVSSASRTPTSCCRVTQCRYH